MDNVPGNSPLLNCRSGTVKTPVVVVIYNSFEILKPTCKFFICVTVKMVYDVPFGFTEILSIPLVDA